MVSNIDKAINNRIVRSMGDEDISHIMLGEFLEWYRGTEKGIYEVTKRLHCDPNFPQNMNVYVLNDEEINVLLDNTWHTFSAEEFGERMLLSNVSVLKAVRWFREANKDMKMEVFGINHEVSNATPNKNQIPLVPMRLEDAKRRYDQKLNEQWPFGSSEVNINYVYARMRSLGCEDFSHISMGELFDWAQNPDKGCEALYEKIHFDYTVPDNRNFEMFCDNTVRVYVQGTWATYTKAEFDSCMHKYAARTLSEVTRLRLAIINAKKEAFQVK